MTSPFSDELISAYLDGELNAEEKAHVESQLRASAELRRMCDELRALRTTLQSLPLVEPTIDLTDRVLRQAERRLLSGAAAEGISEHSEVSSAAQHPARTGRVLRDWRIVAGAVASLAALLLLVLWLPNRPGNFREVATSQQAPDASPPPANPESVHADDTAFGTAERLDVVYSSPADPEARPDLSRTPFLKKNAPQRGVENEVGQGHFDSPAAADACEEQKADYQNKGAPAGDGPGGGGYPQTPSSRGAVPPSYQFGASDRSVQSREERHSNIRSLAPVPPGTHSDMEPPSHAPAEPEAAGGAAAPAGAINQPALATDPVMRSAAEQDFADGAVPAGPEATPEGREARHRHGTGLNDKGIADRGEVGRQLISDFDQHQALLVQVSLPESQDRDSSDWLFQRAGDLVQSSGSSDSVQTMGQSLPEVQLSLSWHNETQQDPPQDALEVKQQLAFPVQDVVLVEGTADAVRASLMKLAAQPDVQVVATAASQDDVRSISTALEDLQRFQKGAEPREGTPGLGAYPGMGGPPSLGSASSAMGLGRGQGGRSPGSLTDQGPQNPFGGVPDSRGGYPGMQGAYPSMFGGGAGGAAAGQLPSQMPQPPSRRDEHNLTQPKEHEGDNRKAGATGRAKATDIKRRAVSRADEGIPESEPKRPKEDSRAVELEKLSDSLQEATVTGKVAAKRPQAGQTDGEQIQDNHEHHPGASGETHSDDFRLKAGVAGEDSATPQPAARRVVTFLFRRAPDPASPSPGPVDAAEPAKQD